MNLIALMQPLSLIKCLKIHLQATFVFFCATSVVQIYFLNTDLILFFKYWCNLFLFYLYLFCCFSKKC